MVAEFLFLIVKYFYYGNFLREWRHEHTNIHVTNYPASKNLDLTLAAHHFDPTTGWLEWNSYWSLFGTHVTVHSLLGV